MTGSALRQEEFLACMDKRMQAVLEEASTVAAHLASPAAPLTGGAQPIGLGCRGQEGTIGLWQAGPLHWSTTNPKSLPVWEGDVSEVAPPLWCGQTSMQATPQQRSASPLHISPVLAFSA